MAKGKTSSVKVVINNKPATTVSQTVELVVVNDQLVPDPNHVSPGVNSIYQ